MPLTKIPTSKKCTCCGEIKLLNEYYNQKKGCLGHRSACKICEKVKKKEYCKQNRDAINEADRKLYAENIEARREKARKYYVENKEAHNEYCKQYHIDNKETENERQKAYRLKNKDRLLKKREERKMDPELHKKDLAYNLEHRMNRIESIKAYHKRKMKTDISYVIKTRMSRSIRNALNRKKQKKETRTSYLLGCKIEGVACHLESLGYDKNIHDIDHIVPISRFDLAQILHRRVAFNFKNMQPLEKSINRSKQNKLLKGWESIIINICKSLNIESIEILNHIQGTIKVA